MVYLIVEYHCLPGKREAFRQAIAEEGLDAASRNEEGNIKYAYADSLEDEDLLILLEIWKDREAFDLHGKQPHFARLGELKKEFVEVTDAEIFDK